jgi:hypothetical protein
MPRKNLTLIQAVERVNGLVDFYSKEKTRLEDNLAKLLLPAGLTFTASMLKDAIDPKYVGAAVFLIGFFLVYAGLIYLDLFAAERLYLNALKLQNDLYAHRDEDGALPFIATVPADLVTDYDAADRRVGQRHYSTPTSKPLFALAGGLVGLLMHRILT